MKKAKLFFSILSVLLSVTLYAQNVTIRGTVTDASNGETLQAATVALRGSTQGVYTDAQGSFSISVPQNGVLVVSMIGYQTADVPVNGRTVINVSLEPDSEFLDEVVVTALGITKSQKAIGYAASTVRSDELTSARVTDAAAAIAGKVAGRPPVVRSPSSSEASVPSDAATSPSMLWTAFLFRMSPCTTRTQATATSVAVSARSTATTSTP